MFNFFKKKNDNKKLVAYAKGKFIPITDVPDPIFSEKMMGDGVAILVKGDTIYAPCDAKVAMVATTFHAVGLNLADGTELLIHIVDKPANKLASQKLSPAENERLKALKSITGVLKNCKPVTIEEIREERIRERYGL